MTDREWHRPIDSIAVPGGGLIGMLPCPGRTGNLQADLARIEAWGAEILVSLIEGDEFARLGVPEFPDAVRGKAFAWHHLPILDMAVPASDFAAAWARSGPAILSTLRCGRRIAIHCAAGLGRTGTVAASLLVALGVPAEDAIIAVRTSRPGAIETAAQADFVRHSAMLSAALPKMGRSSQS